MKTSTPWVCTEISDGRLQIMAEDMDNDDIIADVYKMEDMEFIVKAVNNHDALVEACKEALAIETATNEHSRLKTMLENVLKQASAQ